ncbi:hypothetical protein F511_38409 [Dorcoceras hygrometricum]|uniref:Uncharacterized protein n=1 Tax=Dorcoceras hygrometricum TaxID=472368 RepID=A0A2Z7B7H4_9LAMI|nr:hypothetical protein F511_38409 [Dorcoceras hygrometricum]
MGDGWYRDHCFDITSVIENQQMHCSSAGASFLVKISSCTSLLKISSCIVIVKPAAAFPLLEFSSCVVFQNSAAAFL